jgi:CheY-like chemotaxis protein
MLVSEYEELVAKGDKVLEKKEKSVFSSAVWSSDQKINEIMTAIELPIAIVEHSSVHTQIVRANSYHIKKYGKGLPGGMDDFSRDCLRVCMEEAEEKGIAETEIKCMIEDGDMRLVNVKMKCIEKNSKASLLCSVSIDITNERKYEAQLRKLSRMLPTGERTKMLIADDSKISREMLGVLFSDRFDILYAEDGIEALSILKREKDRIAVILLDLHMPNMDGKDFLTAKNKQNYADDIPVIIISSDAALEVQYDMLAMGVMDYYSKPYNPKILKSKVNNAIMYAERYHNLRTEFANAIKNTD